MWEGVYSTAAVAYRSLGYSPITNRAMAGFSLDLCFMDIELKVSLLKVCTELYNLKYNMVASGHFQNSVYNNLALSAVWLWIAKFTFYVNWIMTLSFDFQMQYGGSLQCRHNERHLSKSWFIGIPAWMSDYIPRKVRDEISYTFPNSMAAFEVWEWKSKFIPHFIKDNTNRSWD